MRESLTVALATSLLCLSVGAQSPKLVGDLNTFPLRQLSSSPVEFTEFGSSSAFVAETQAGGREVVIYSPSQGLRVLDVMPGTVSSQPSELVASIVRRGPIWQWLAKSL